jgi:hypothetical protein
MILSTMPSKGKTFASKRGRAPESPDFVVKLPRVFSFTQRDVFDPDFVLSIFDWQPQYSIVEIDLSANVHANYQAVSLLVLYAWHLRSRSCKVRFKRGPVGQGATGIFDVIGARSWSSVLENGNAEFITTQNKPMFAIRNQRDFSAATQRVESYTRPFNVEYEKTLRYVVSELLYNTLEHGHTFYTENERQVVIPSLIQFAWYSSRNELVFIVSDLGVGIKKHLEQAYQPFLDHASAIRFSLNANVSGTFGSRTPYANKDNAGVGLYISSNLIRRLNADMYLISCDGLVHVSPADVTSRTLKCNWPGTTVLVSVKLGVDSDLNLQRMMSEVRSSAATEMKVSTERESGDRLYLLVHNIFGKYAEDKQAAIRYRDNKLLPSLQAGQSVLIDFENVVSSPHSFLSALLATPVQTLEMAAYKKIKIINAPPEIRETIDLIFDKETS